MKNIGYFIRQCERALFALPIFLFAQTATAETVFATAGVGGSITPAWSTVSTGEIVSLTVTLESGFDIAGVTGCGGSLSGNTYTTGQVTVDCTMRATFALQEGSVATQIAAGGTHACALTSDGGVKCWGQNDQGQLGDNSTSDHRTPVDVEGMTSGVIAIAAGGSHTCALTNGGGVKCWGNNDYGQLGDGSRAERLTPVDVSGLASGVTAIAAGSNHTCAVTADGGVKCWGDNSGGQLGIGVISYYGEPTPVAVSGLTSGVAGLSAGGGRTCALTNSTGVKCWGADNLTAVDVSGLTTGVSAIAVGGNHACVIVFGGGVKCWGSNDRGQLGDNSTTDQVTPVDVVGLSGAVAITAGYRHTCAITGDGGVNCWGDNWYGMLGDDSMTGRLTPVEVSGLTGRAASVVAGDWHTCILTGNGEAKCWGNDEHGQLGDNGTPYRVSPVDVIGLGSGVDVISLGGGHSCAVTSMGGVRCWGANYYGQLGDDSTNSRLVPVDVSGLTSGMASVAGGGAHTCALSNGGGVKCWGHNESGQLGNDSTLDQLSPVEVSGLATGVSTIAAGGDHTCAVTDTGGAKCWGSNVYGQLGDGSNVDRLTPVDVFGLTSGVTAIVAGNRHTCALTSEGGVKCWPHCSSLTPVDVIGLTNGVSSIVAGWYKTCAVTIDGGVNCWGSCSLTPEDVSGLSGNVNAVAVGLSHACALTSDGELKCWGSNDYGQLGDGSTYYRSTPVDVNGLTSDVVAVAAGDWHTCALVSGGAVKCWGENYYGELGDGTASARAYPAPAWPDVNLYLDANTGLEAQETAIAVIAQASWPVEGDKTLDLTVSGIGITDADYTLISTVLTIPDGMSTGDAIFSVTNDSLIEDTETATIVLTNPASGITLGGASIRTLDIVDDDATEFYLLTVNSSGHGAVSSGGTHAAGATVYLTAAPDVGYHLGGWSPSPCADSFVMSYNDLTCTANFALNSYTVSAIAGSGGSISPTSATVTYGSSTSFTLDPDSSHIIEEVTGCGGFLSGNTYTTAFIADNCVVHATFALKTYTLNTLLGAGGNISPRSDTVSHGYTTSFTINPIINFAIDSVAGCGGTLSGNIYTTGAITGDCTVSVNFVRTSYTVLATAGVGGTVSPAWNVVPLEGGVASLVVTPQAGFTIASVTGCGGALSGTTYTTGLVSEDCRVMATFRPLEGAVALQMAANDHSCVLTSAGGVKCWGSNSGGQLGNNSTIDQVTPVEVNGLSSGVMAIAAGGYHTCALTKGGGVKCWGNNSYGQLGDNTTISQMTPVDVSGLSSGVAAIVAGRQHTCALTSSGGVKCWGVNWCNQLGDASGEIWQLTPVDVSGLTTGVSAITADSEHTCALTNSGGVKCWGENWYGQLGDGSDFLRNTPVDVNGLSAGVMAISAGDDHTCALTNGGGVQCWGFNSSGQLGDNTDYNWRLTPVNVSGLTSGVIDIAAGGYHTCALIIGGGVKCWGSNGNGQSGNSSPTNQLVPVDVIGLTSGVAAIYAGADHTCAITTGGGVKCWGENWYGQLGDNSTTTRWAHAPAWPDINLSLSATTGYEAQQTAITLTAQASWPVEGAKTLDLTIGGVGITPADYTLNPGVITIPDGISKGGATFSVLHDGLPEGEETATVALTNPSSGVALGATTFGAVRIVDTDPFQLTVTSDGHGTVSGGGAYLAGATVNLTATPNAGYVFAGWSPFLCAGTFAMPASNLTCSAAFAPNMLSVTKSGTGSGAVTTSPAGINCGSTCSFAFNSGQSVTLTAAPASGSGLAGWGGACSGVGSCVLTMNGPKTVSATFIYPVNQCVADSLFANTTYAGNYYCNAATRIQATDNVVVSNTGKVIYSAPVVRLLPGVIVQLGGNLHLGKNLVNSFPAGRAEPVSGSGQRRGLRGLNWEDSIFAPHLLPFEELPAGLLKYLGENPLPEEIELLLSDGDGRYIVFATAASLDPNDGNGVSDVYAYRTEDDSLLLVSRNAKGEAGRGASDWPTIDGRGEWILFHSAAPDLTVGDDDGVSDIFLYQTSDGLLSNLTSEQPDNSAHPAVDRAGE